MSVAALRKMAEWGLSIDQAAELLELIEDERKPARSSGAERQRRYRERQAESVTCDVTRDVTDTPSPSLPPRTPPSRPHPRGDIYPTREDGSDFEAFWQAYPAKIGKKAAAAAWSKAKDRPPLDTVLAAIDQYRRAKPPDREWCHPSTWLNQGRWADEPPPEPQRNPRNDRSDPRSDARSVWSDILAERDSPPTGPSPPLRLAG